MKYKDDLTASEQEYNIMRQSYTQALEMETGDLREISQKMKHQKDYLNINNSDGKYVELIRKLEDNIKQLDALIVSNQSHFLHKYRNLTSGNINADNSNYLGEAIPPIRRDTSTPNTNTPNTTPNLEPNINIPTPSRDNLDQNTTPTFPTLDDILDNREDNNNGAIPPSNENNAPNNTNTLKRNCPKQGNTIFDAIKQINVNINKFFGKKTRKNSVANMQIVNNRWHVIMPSEIENIENTKNGVNTTKNRTYSEDCEPKKVMLHNQIDIIRLFLLYLMLRPNCKYLSQVTAIANSQFDIMLALM